jgi:hypothetical protein
LLEGGALSSVQTLEVSGNVEQVRSIGKEEGNANG